MQYTSLSYEKRVRFTIKIPIRVHDTFISLSHFKYIFKCKSLYLNL